MPTRRSIATALLAGAAVTAATAATAQDKPQGPDLVVYHVSDSQAQALAALRNIRNHLDTEPSTKIIVVTHADGVDFLMEGAKDRNGGPYAGPVAALKNRGVEFQVCEITLKNRALEREQFLMEADFVASGVVQLARLQRQGYAYIRP